MSATRLRPLAVGEILDVAIKAYSTNVRTLIAIGAIVGIPFELLNGLVQLSTVSTPDQLTGALTFHTGTTNLDYSRARITGLVVTALIGGVVTLVVTAATVKAVSDAYLGNQPTVRDSLRFAARRIGSLIWLYVLLGVGLTVAFILLFIPGVWLYAAWSLATPVLLVEGIRGTAALRRSFRLVRGRWWSTAFTLVIAWLLVSIASGVVVGVFLIVPQAIDGSSVLLAVVGSTIASSVAVAIVQPIRSAIITVLYFDLRVRKDGFDLALLAAGLGLPPAELPLFTLPARALAPTVAGATAVPTEAPPFWPPPPGWKPSAPAPPPPPGWPPLAPAPPSPPASSGEDPAETPGGWPAA